jgi:hypothetical protein
VTFVAPWDEFVQALQPAFAMDEQKALSSVLPSTQDVTEKFLDAFQARLRVAPPRSSETRTDTLAQAGAERTEKTTTELKTEPGDVSSVSEAPSAVAGRKAADLPGRDVSAEPLAVDPMLQHSAALALFQEVALLNATVRRAALRYGYVPYVVRLQISLMPFA